MNSKMRRYYYVYPFLFMFSSLLAYETKWIAVGMLHNWYSSAGCEIEVGRTHQIPDQQDGLRWPAQFRNQDCQAAKSLWIGTTNYYDMKIDKTYPYKVVHVGPRVTDEASGGIMPQEFILKGRFNHPLVYVDGLPASQLDYMDIVDETDASLPVDRVLHNVVNTSIGITLTRKIYALSQQNHDNYFIYDFVFKNTGIIDKDLTLNPQTLEDVHFFWQYRYAISREGGVYGGNWLPQSHSWGHNTVNDARGEDPTSGDPFRALFSWQGLHSKAGYNNIGGPNIDGDGHLGAVQYVGVVTIHADKSATDKSDDPFQPTTTQNVGSDEAITSGNDQYNEPKMADEWKAMTFGHPAERHAVASDCANPIECTGYADEFGGTPGGYSLGQGFGPYTLEPGDSIHIVIAEGVNGISRELCYSIGAEWLNGSGPFELPGGSSTTNDADTYKNAWVYTGQDSLFQTFERAIQTYNSNFDVPLPPPPPSTFNVTSGGDRIILEWAGTPEDEDWPNFAGYNVYRAIHVPDTTFELIAELGPAETIYEDKSAIRGFDYYYYVSSVDDGSTNREHPGVPLESGMFYTRTSEPAYLRRPPSLALEKIRVVPNPYNIKARALQYGDGGPDRIMFLNIPPVCTISIFTERGDLIKTIQHVDGTGDEAWNSVSSSRQVVASGLYIAYFEVMEDYYHPLTNQLVFEKGQSAIRKFIIIR